MFGGLKNAAPKVPSSLPSGNASQGSKIPINKGTSSKLAERGMDLQLFGNKKGSSNVGESAIEGEEKFIKTGKLPGSTIDKNTGYEVGTIYVDSKGNAMISPKGGGFTSGGYRGLDTHTTYPNGSAYQRNNTNGHRNSQGINHGHGHLPGTGSDRGGTGHSIDVNGNMVPYNSPDAHWRTYR